MPVKAARIGKSRLGGSPELARAIAADSLDAVLRASLVARVILVTADRQLPRMLVVGADRGARLVVVAESGGSGISAAVLAGLAVSARERPRAVLLGDVPALEPLELDAALVLAGHARRAFVPDADGEGTVLVTAASGVRLREAFGAGSAAAHRALGLVELAVGAETGLRRDVDTREQLAEVIARAPASRTARAASQLA